MTWGAVPLREIATIERNSVSPANIKSGSRYVGLEHIEGGGRSLSFGSVSNGELASSKFQFSADHILFGKLRPYLAKIVCPDFDGICSTDILPILPGRRIDQRYLLHYLRRPETVDWATTRSTGVNLPRLSPKELAELEIPLPPLDEQRRIAAILDKADALRRRQPRALFLSDQLAHSRYEMAFGDPVTNPKELPATDLGRLGVEMVYGPRFYNEEYSQDGVRIVRITDLTEAGELDFEAMPRLNVSEIDLLSYRSRPGELLFARTGATVGKVALVSAEDPVSVPGAYFVRLRFPDQVDPIFAWYTLRSKAIQEIIAERSRQSAQQNFSGPGLRRLPFIVPPAEQQRAFAMAVGEIRKLKVRCRVQIAHFEALFASLQHRAFSGQL